MDSLLERCPSARCVVAIDVAKEKMVAAVMTEQQEVLVTVKWSHPLESKAFYSWVEGLGAQRRVEVAMEPTGTYGDALRFHLMKRNIPVYLVQPKLVHDAREVFDGVPSSHDAKACAVIGMLHLSGRSRRYEAPSESRRALKAATKTLHRYERQFARERRQLAAILAAFWPGFTEILSLGTRSGLTLLATFGSPKAVSAAPEQARELMLKASRKLCSDGQLKRLLESAGAECGEDPLPAEVGALKLLAEDALRTRDRVLCARSALEALAVKDDASAPLIPLLGKATSGALVAELGDLRTYESPASIVRACGLNLKEASSGEFKGRLTITKRGSSRARHYLFYAALRLIRRDRHVRAWHRKKQARSSDSGLISVTAIMRKLASALWHVARGNEFDASKLYNAKNLDLTAEGGVECLPDDGLEDLSEAFVAEAASQVPQALAETGRLRTSPKLAPQAQTPQVLAEATLAEAAP